MRDAIHKRIEKEKEKGGRAVKPVRSSVRTADGITLKQEEFLHQLVKGLPIVEAYLAVFQGEKMQRSDVYRAASNMLDRPAVAARLMALVEERKKRSLAADAKWIRQHVLDRLMIESLEYTKGTQAGRIRALELLGKVDVVGMFTEKVQTEVTHKRSSEEVESEIRAKLEAYLNQLTVVNKQQSGQ